MYIVLHCGGMAFNGNTINERSLGGSESAAYYVAKGLAERGHDVVIFTNHREGGTFDGVKYVWAGEPREGSPLGTDFHFYAENTPHDVLIVQRHPAAFNRQYASRINLLWLHDLALGRYLGQMESQMWNLDGVLCVSQFHRKQICDVYKLSPEFVYAIGNGIDLELFMDTPDQEVIDALAADEKVKDRTVTTKLLYSSRPERGLENLVGEDGIMERLAKRGSPHHLYVCGYDNTTAEMAPFYTYLWDRCNALPNVTNLGALTKQHLADVMKCCNILVYPTTFEEVSCITVMEAIAADMCVLSSKHAALPETLKGAPGVKLLPLKNGAVDKDMFIRWLDKVENMKSNGRYHAEEHYSWVHVLDVLLDKIHGLSEIKMNSFMSVYKECMANSDIMQLKRVVSDDTFMEWEFANACKAELKLYDFANSPQELKTHYEEYYTYEEERGVSYGPEDLSGNSRFQVVATRLRNILKDGDVLLDYGCAHGHYTVNLAKMFPKCGFIGVDVAASNIVKAKQWVDDENLENCLFFVGDASDFTDELNSNEHFKNAIGGGVKAILAGEVLEHVAEPARLLSNLYEFYGMAAEDSYIIATTPYGPWESQEYRTHWPWRAHLHHFDKDQLKDLLDPLGENNLELLVVPCGRAKDGTPLGSFVGISNLNSKVVGQVRPQLKIPNRQSVSLCMIVKDAEDTLLKTIKSVEEVVDEIIISVDPTTKDGTMEVIESYVRNKEVVWPVVHWGLLNKPVLETGFDEARNYNIAQASCDWILVVDSDETISNPYAMLKYLRRNQYDGYAVRQHHFSVQPLGVIKTDLPVRLFRNNKGIKYFGKVHEHPEKGMNEGIGKVHLINDVEIIHPGYENESIRRKRFSRNIGLMSRDRQENPKRMLGKFLWLRDLVQMCMFEFEQVGAITPTMNVRLTEAVKIWHELLEDAKHDKTAVRFICEGLVYYTEANRVLNQGIDFSIKVNISKLHSSGAPLSGEPELTGRFLDRDTIMKFFDVLTKEKFDFFNQKYL